jgi:hypothetical protein
VQTVSENIITSLQAFGLVLAHVCSFQASQLLLLCHCLYVWACLQP